MVRRLLLSLVLSVFVGRAPVARADTAFLMEPAVETERIGPDVQARALKAARAALRAHGDSVITREDAKKAGVVCGSRDCLVAALDKLKADYGVLVTMITTPEAGAALGSLGVGLHDRESVFEGGSVRVLDLGIERAVDESIRAARGARSRGPGPWLLVQGTPPDVELYIDGARVDDGDLPCDVRVAPDRMLDITAKRDGYRADEYHLQIGSSPVSSYSLQVALRPDTGASLLPERAPPSPPSGGVDHNSNGSGVPPGARLATWQDWTLGAALLVGGVALSINPLRTLTHQGDACDDGDCSAPVEFGPRSGVLLGLGAALTLTGVVVPIWWKPFGKLAVVADEHSAVLSMRGAWGDAR